MKTTIMMKTVAGSFAACLALGAAAADISGVTVRQRWPWSRLVDIDYVLCDATQAVDVAVTAYNGSTPLTLPDGSLSGDRHNVSADGTHRIVFDPTVTAYTNLEVLAKFKVSLTPTAVPLYMIVDLTKSAGADGQIEYVYPGDARLVTDGRYTNVWFDVTNDAAYATTKLVLRRVRAGAFNMGPSVPPISSVTLTKGFYVGIFELTFSQNYHITGSGSDTVYPAVGVSYDTIRGATNGVPAIDYPTTGPAVSPSSIVGQLRAKTGLQGFDLPTEAQWEYTSRAGTATYYNDESSTSANTNVLDRLAWWLNNSNGKQIQKVGGKEANNWGLYDTLGNTWEWCLNWGPTGSGTDPTGPTTGTRRYMRGGCADSDFTLCRPSSWINYFKSSEGASRIGFRVVLNLP